MDRRNDMCPCCRPESTIVGPCYRFSILTPQLIRMEYARDGVFEDRPTQLAVNRFFPAVTFQVFETEDRLEISTEYLNLLYEKGPFTAHSLQIKVRSECCGIYCTWHFSEPILEGLGGTARTLDQADGEIPLEPGIQSRIGGFGVLDDSKSAVIQSDGSAVPRKKGIEDTYFFGYGFAYLDCLHDYFRLTGFTPLLPRYALGNWWSRFHAYTDQEYLELMNRFGAERVPLSVSVIDMDWHLREIDPKYGKGWTGFTWNEELFQEPERFLADLHAKGLKVTLNLHPAEGIQPHERMYEQISMELHRDPELGQPVPFDFCDQSFIHAYFQLVIHPLEAQGVDFWWLDWQQGRISRQPGLDPLWLLNYYHFCDADRSNHRPMILSRYAGPGSHRFPIGFSGDSIISWKSLDFQPFFTATAANIGYGWWSHDIGGHAAGRRDVELQTRWVQFGVFSPIFRLHSTSNPFNGKEPWKYPEPSRQVMSRFMRLRHRLIPYLYTMNWRCHANGDMLVEPMYYRYPREADAYLVKNQYSFGTELLVCPITQPMSKISNRACTTVWLPEEDYYDFFSGIHYRGKRKMNVHRDLSTIPVFAKAGGIVPLTDEMEACCNGAALPQKLELRVFAGHDGAFTLVEDDGLTKAYEDGAIFKTKFQFCWRASDGATRFTIIPERTMASYLPASRRYTVSFVGVMEEQPAITRMRDSSVPISRSYDPLSSTLSIVLPPCLPTDAIEISFPDGLRLAPNPVERQINEILDDATIAYETKEQVYRVLGNVDNKFARITELLTLNLPNELLGALLEVILAE